jgi:hypothetical protein
MKLIKANMAKIEADFALKGVADAILFDENWQRCGMPAPMTTTARSSGF